MKKQILILTTSLFFAVFVYSQTFQIENNALILPSAISFESGSDVLKPESEVALKHVLAYLNEKTYISLMRIEGHVFSSGNEAANQLLSEKRALIICKWLIKNGVDCNRLIAVGFGSMKPIADNTTPEGRALNQRIVFVNVALRGRNIGGMPSDGGGVVAGDVCVK